METHKHLYPQVVGRTNLYETHATTGRNRCARFLAEGLILSRYQAYEDAQEQRAEMAFDWLVKTVKRLWGSDDHPYYRDPITPLVRDWRVSEAEAWRVVDVYARMAGADSADAIEQLQYLSYEETLEQIGEQ